MYCSGDDTVVWLPPPRDGPEYRQVREDPRMGNKFPSHLLLSPWIAYRTIDIRHRENVTKLRPGSTLAQSPLTDGVVSRISIALSGERWSRSGESLLWSQRYST